MTLAAMLGEMSGRPLEQVLHRRAPREADAAELLEIGKAG
jgi:hypothetical protein